MALQLFGSISGTLDSGEEISYISRSMISQSFMVYWARNLPLHCNVSDRISFVENSLTMCPPLPQVRVFGRLPLSH